MLEAIELAKKAATEEEMPIGAIIVRNNEIIASGYNQKEQKKNSLLHAEIVAMNKACEILDSKYLDDCELYVTLEPCAMCAGAMMNYRVTKLYFGAYEPKSGCCGSLYNLPEDKRFNHRIEIVGGIMEEECSSILKNFFAERRKKRC